MIVGTNTYEPTRQPWFRSQIAEFPANYESTGAIARGGLN